MTRRILPLAFALLLTLSASAAAAPIPMRGTIPLRVNEKASNFDVPAKTLIVRPGIEKFVVLVPKSSNLRHAIGIDGGGYHHIEGEAVRRGRSTSITAWFRPGDYTVYDAYKSNARRGFRVRVHVVRNQGGRHDLGTKCVSDEFTTEFTTYVASTECSVALGLVEPVYEQWRAQDFGWEPVSAAGFACAFDPFSVTGLTIRCTNGDQRVNLTP